MGAIVSIIGFIYLTHLLFKSFRGPAIVKDPLNSREGYYVTRYEHFFILLFATGLFQCGELLAIRLFILEALCIYVIFKIPGKIKLSFPLVVYGCYLLWLVIGLLYTDVFGFGVRMILKYIYPLLVAVMASLVVRKWEVLHCSFYYARNIAVIAALIGLPYIGRFEALLMHGLFWYSTARAIHFISISMILLALYYHEDAHNKWNRIIAFALMIPCILWVFRTSIMGTAVAFAVFMFFRYKLKALPAFGAIVALSLIVVFTVPQVNQKMFKGQGFTVEDLFKGRISLDDVESNGRFRMWEVVEHNFYEGHELVGSGTGAVQEFMYSNGVDDFGGARIIHNDYMQMRCDNGLIGFWLYILAEIMLIVHCFIVYARSDNKWVKICAISAGSSLAGMALTLLSDNVVNYSMATLAYPYLLYGSMLGLLRTKPEV